MTQPDILTIVEETLPSGTTFGMFYINGYRIGGAFKAENGWKIAYAGRVVLPARIVAKKMLDQTIAKAKRKVKAAQALRDLLRESGKEG